MADDEFRSGPWVYDGSLTVYQNDEGTPNVCVVSDDEFAEANAFLICAAPSMIRLLREWQRDLRNHGPLPGSPRAKQLERIDQVLALALNLPASDRQSEESK